MPEPNGLLAVARLLLATDPPPTGEALRRAASTAYYAVFHMVLRHGAERFMGPGAERSAGYRLLYRGFAHGRMKAVCEALDAARLSQPLQRQLGRSAMSQAMRDFASAFVALQEIRHRADYDPGAAFDLSDVEETVAMAEIAMSAFETAAAAERADVLALMLLNPRG
jgi:hypothetical protein